MRITIALALLGLTAVLAGELARADELRLRKVNEQVIEGPFGGTRCYVRATPSGRLVIENSWGRRVGTVRPLPGGERAIGDCRRRRGCLELPD